MSRKIFHFSVQVLKNRQFSRKLHRKVIEMDKPACLLKPLVVPEKILMGPGPSNISPRVQKAMAQPMLGHLHPETLKIMDDIKEGLQYIFQTKNRLTLVISASGHSAIETCMSNLIEPGDTVVIAENGIWGERAGIMAERYGGRVQKLRGPPGQSFQFSDIEKALQKFKPVLFFITQGESSTGVYQQIEGLGSLCHKYDCLLVVDAVASLGGVPMFADKWEIDAVYTGSQKVLGAPPGLSPISFSAKAEARVRSRKSAVPVYYWDMLLLGDYWNCFGNPRIYHHTIPVSMLYGLREGLAQVVEEGLDVCNQRHKECANRLYTGLKDLNLNLFVKNESDRLPTVTTIEISKDVNWTSVTEYAMKKYSLEISGGLGPTKGLVWRIGIMGYNANSKNVDLCLQAMKEALQLSTSRL